MPSSASGEGAKVIRSWPQPRDVDVHAHAPMRAPAPLTTPGPARPETERGWYGAVRRGAYAGRRTPGGPGVGGRPGRSRRAGARPTGARAALGRPGTNSATAAVTSSAVHSSPGGPTVTSVIATPRARARSHQRRTGSPPSPRPAAPPPRVEHVGVVRQPHLELVGVRAARGAPGTRARPSPGEPLAQRLRRPRARGRRTRAAGAAPAPGPQRRQRGRELLEDLPAVPVAPGLRLVDQGRRPREHGAAESRRATCRTTRRRCPRGPRSPRRARPKCVARLPQARAVEVDHRVAFPGRLHDGGEFLPGRAARNRRRAGAVPASACRRARRSRVSPSAVGSRGSHVTWTVRRPLTAPNAPRSCTSGWASGCSATVGLPVRPAQQRSATCCAIVPVGKNAAAGYPSSPATRCSRVSDDAAAVHVRRLVQVVDLGRASCSSASRSRRSPGNRRAATAALRLPVARAPAAPAGAAAPTVRSSVLRRVAHAPDDAVRRLVRHTRVPPRRCLVPLSP